MYQEYWKLSVKPFENTPDPDFLFHSAQHEEAFSRLVYAVEEGKGAAILSGVFGCGKTLLARGLLRYLDPSLYKVAFINNPRMSAIELLLEVATKLGAQNLPTKKSEVLKNDVWEIIETLLRNNLRDGKRTVLMIDEAHAIQDPEIFEELRLLLNFQADDHFYLTLLLFGQPELKEKIETNKQLAQRLAIGYHLQQLDSAEVVSYIRFRMKQAGGKEGAFSDEALKLIGSYSGGIPRRINQICDFSLLVGMQKEAKTVTPEIVKEGVSGLGV